MKIRLSLDVLHRIYQKCIVTRLDHLSAEIRDRTSFFFLERKYLFQGIKVIKHTKSNNIIDYGKRDEEATSDQIVLRKHNLSMDNLSLW